MLYHIYFYKILNVNCIQLIVLHCKTFLNAYSATRYVCQSFGYNVI